MSDTVVGLRNRALECERKASLAEHSAVRRTFLELARQWRELAALYEERVGEERASNDNAA